jgi:hypothetical protein
LEFGIVAEGVAGVVVVGVAAVPVVPLVVVPEVVAPDVVPDTGVPLAAAAAAAPPVCTHAAPPATAVSASANAAFLRSYLIGLLLEIFLKRNAAGAAAFRKIYRVSPEPFGHFIFAPTKT